jgi:hypothetical protein
MRPELYIACMYLPDNGKTEIRIWENIDFYVPTQARKHDYQKIIMTEINYQCIAFINFQRDADLHDTVIKVVK